MTSQMRLSVLFGQFGLYRNDSEQDTIAQSLAVSASFYLFN